MKVINETIALLLLVIGVYYVIRRFNGKNITIVHTISPFNNWSLDEMNNENILVPWSEIFKSRLATIDELKSMGLHNNLKENTIVVYYRSPQDSWEHLAGRAGYVLISIKEKKQLDFIMTVMN